MAAVCLLSGAQAQPPAAPGAAGTWIELPANDEGVRVTALWWPVAGAATRRPAVVALHGCGGLFRRDDQRLDTRYPDYAARLHDAGFHVLLPDSFSARGVRQVCTPAPSAPRVGAALRRQDVSAAVAWLAQRPDVDARGIVLLGWSHGAMTVLEAIDGAQRPAVQPVAAAVAFYPSCRGLDARTYRPAAPLTLLLGEKDDWTPPARCVALAERLARELPQVPVRLQVYADSYHGFDSERALRFRRDIKSGVDPAGVHQGGNPQARAAALQELEQVLRRVRAQTAAPAAARDGRHNPGAK